MQNRNLNRIHHEANHTRGFSQAEISRGITLVIANPDGKTYAKVKLPRAIYAAIRECCSLRGWTLSEFLNRAMSEKLARSEQALALKGGAK